MSFKTYLWNKRTLVTRSPRFAPIGSAILNIFSWAMRHNPLQVLSPRLRNAHYLNVGCGKKAQSGFLNLDFIWQPGVHLVWDLKWRLPIPPNSLSGIYTEHCLEHISLRLLTRRVLPEFRRILAPGGTLRIIVPDAELYLKLYGDALAKPDVSFPYPEWDLPTPMMHVNECFRGFGHQYAYDFATFRIILEQAGFKDIERLDYRHGRDPKLLIDSEDRRVESLYLEAVK